MDQAQLLEVRHQLHRTAPGHLQSARQACDGGRFTQILLVVEVLQGVFDPYPFGHSDELGQTHEEAPAWPQHHGQRGSNAGEYG